MKLRLGVERLESRENPSGLDPVDPNAGNPPPSPPADPAPPPGDPLPPGSDPAH
ncbi:MAG TPA: hypothetical protein VGJ05_04110 [Fimbriiglobus sp.]|jgi:hypothetical protein